jgi:hypothetical protein
MVRTAFLASAVVVAVSATTARAVDKFADLLRFLPPEPANAVVVADCTLLYRSPLAVKENWATTAPLGLPPTIQEAVLAAELAPDLLRGAEWEAGVAYLNVRLTMDELARREKGARDTVAGAEAVLSPRNAYFFDIRPWTVGMQHPADRQDLAQWVRANRNAPTVRLSPFLAESILNLGREAQFVLAIDLTDALHPDQVRRRLGESRALSGQSVDLDAAAKALAGLRGVRLDVRVTDAIQGELRAVFAEEVKGFNPAVALALLRGFLSERGAEVEELADWAATAEGQAVVFRGPLSSHAFRRVTMLLMPPAPAAGPGEGDGGPLAAELKLLASQYFFRAIQTYLADLQKPTRQAKRSFENFALWYETSAKKVDQLTPYNVDEDLLKYGYGVAERLRAIAASLRGVAVDVADLEKRISFGVSAGMAPGWGWRPQPYLFVQTNQAEIVAKQRDAIDRGEQTRRQIWQTIEAETAAIKAKMEQKFGTQFEAGR